MTTLIESISQRFASHISGKVMTETVPISVYEWQKILAIIEEHKRESGDEDTVTIDSEELSYLKDMDEHVRQITKWLRERSLYHDADYFGEGVDYPAILTMHENELLRPQPSHTKLIGELVAALDVISPRFVSGNDIPVSRATIPTEEWAAIDALLTKAREAVK